KVIIDEKIIAVVTIKKREGIVHRTSDGRYYIRVGSTVRDATPEELSRMFQQAEMIHHDVAPVYNTFIDDIDNKRVKYYLSNVLYNNIDNYKDVRENILENIKAITRVDNTKYLTVDGLLVFCENPQKYLPKTCITAVKFRGKDMDYNMIDKKEITGSLMNQYSEKGEVLSYGMIEQAIKYVMTFTSNSSTMDGVRRVETAQYPIESIREVIVNAAAHRDYTISGSEIRLFIFSDRIEIHSPGKLPNTIKIENLKRTAHYTRNPELYKFLAQYGYADEVGLGIPEKIIKKMIVYTGKEPQFEESGESFIVTLFGKEE
ncbi:MAG: histidine kinase, partial [Candidatus Firestonebacteria bacterium]|nr:histidine kinase [Candidatus Firestonebacteria bacterium]